MHCNGLTHRFLHAGKALLGHTNHQLQTDLKAEALQKFYRRRHLCRRVAALRCRQHLIIERLHAKLHQAHAMTLQKLQAFFIYIVRARRKAHTTDKAFVEQRIRQRQQLLLQLQGQAGKAAAVKRRLVGHAQPQPAAPTRKLLLGTCNSSQLLSANRLLIAKNALMRTACMRYENRQNRHRYPFFRKKLSLNTKFIRKTLLTIIIPIDIIPYRGLL